VACEALPPGRTYGYYEVRAQAECARLCGSTKTVSATGKKTMASWGFYGISYELCFSVIRKNNAIPHGGLDVQPFGRQSTVFKAHNEEKNSKARNQGTLARLLELGMVR
jgi:hypothetical protein